MTPQSIRRLIRSHARPAVLRSSFQTWFPSSPQVYESDREYAFWRPPPFVDGTPNESVHDVLVRVRQLLSILETQYQGDQILIVSPDSDNLSVLQVGKRSRPGAAPAKLRSFFAVL